MKAVSLFSGIGGIEFGLARHGIETTHFCEIDPLARAILKKNFPDADILEDVMAIDRLPRCDLVTAGFPCQDLSQAGGKLGLRGSKSSLVLKLFDLIAATPSRHRPNAILIENVPYMLRLDRGRAMGYLTSTLHALGYKWAYRTVDARCFGIPQRRPRVVLMAARDTLPQSVLFEDNIEPPVLDGRPSDVDADSWYGFYWTEGSRGVGWARNAVPPIKCGSTIGIPSPPAIWLPRRDFVGTPDIRDAERLQGFPEDWTLVESNELRVRPSSRWRLVGNAVSTTLSNWIGARLQSPGPGYAETCPISEGDPWPAAATLLKGRAVCVQMSKWASTARQTSLAAFLKYPQKPLSSRATFGFLSRAVRCTNIVYAQSFLNSLNVHATEQEREAA